MERSEEVTKLLLHAASLQEKFEYEAAAKFYERAAEKCPNDPEVLDAAAEAMLEAGMPEKGELVGWPVA